MAAGGHVADSVVLVAPPDHDVEVAALGREHLPLVH